MRARRLGFIASHHHYVYSGMVPDMHGALHQRRTRESYKKEVQEKLKALDKEIDELKGKAAELKGEAKTDFNKEMTELHKKRKAAKKEWGK